MEMTEAIRTFLEEIRFGVAATINRDGSPQQTVVWYLLRGDEIIMNTARGRLKELNLRRDPRMSLCVEDGYRYVTIRGRAALDENPVTTQQDIQAIVARYEGTERALEMMRRQFSKEERVSIRLKIEKISDYGF
ncbi:MAG TPA: PPOX class F420-dependent oxidoreductase [Chloroflexia bacterium]|nr:PPOX class F420-dependent oxidoreductase [Chloroflexia bacterium]